MRNKYYQIFNLYYQYIPFRILSACLVATALLSRFSLKQKYYYVADDFFTFFLVVSVWLGFTSGVLLKRQMAHPRAALLPDYRIPHIIVPYSFFAFFIAVYCYWLSSLYPLIILEKAAVWSVFLLSVLIINLIIWVGYLSISLLVYVSYFLLLVISWQTFNLVILITEQAHWQLALALASVALLLLLAWRMTVLNEDKFEYGYIISWPHKEFLHNQIKAGELYVRAIHFIKSRLGLKPRRVAVPPYPREAALWRRAYHWHYLDLAELKSIWILLVVLTPVYVYRIPGMSFFHDFYRDPYSNFLLYAIAPVLIVLCSNYRNMSTWPHDLLKPVRKKDFIKEQGAGLLAGLGLYWLLFVMYLVFIPHCVLQPAALLSSRFWGYLALSGSFAFLTLSWVIFMSTYSSRPWFVLANGSVLVGLAQLLFVVAGKQPFMINMLNSALCWVGIYLFLKWGYRKWCQAETA